MLCIGINGKKLTASGSPDNGVRRGSKLRNLDQSPIVGAGSENLLAPLSRGNNLAQNARTATGWAGADRKFVVRIKRDECSWGRLQTKKRAKELPEVRKLYSCCECYPSRGRTGMVRPNVGPTLTFPALEGALRSGETAAIYMQFLGGGKLTSPEDLFRPTGYPRRTPFAVSMSQAKRRKYFKSLSGRYRSGASPASTMIRHNPSFAAGDPAGAWNERLRQGLFNYISVISSNKYKVRTMA